MTRDRGAGRRHAGRLDRRRRRARHRRRTASRASSSPPGDIDAIADRLRALADGPGAAAPARRGRTRRVRERYSVPRLVRRRRPPLPRAARRAARAAARPSRADAAPARAARDAGRPRRAQAPDHPRLAVLPARGRRDAVADAGVRRVPRRARARGDGRSPSSRTIRTASSRRSTAAAIVEDDRSNPYRVLRVWVQDEPGEDADDAARRSTSRSWRSRPRSRRSPGRADVVVATTPPLFTGVAGLAIARLNARAARARRPRPLAGGRDEPAPDLAGLGDQRRRGARAAALPRGRRRSSP